MQLTINVPPLLLRRAKVIAGRKARTGPQVVRAALESYVRTSAVYEEARRTIRTAFRKQGIRRMADVERLVDEVRSRD